MRKTMLLILASVCVATLSLTACDRENEKENEREYPVTADVIHNAVKDIDGNKYDAVRIGDQVWMAENLKTTRFADGTEIELKVGGTTTAIDQPYRYYPNGKEERVKDFGYLYTWPAVMHGAGGSNANPSGVQGICPKGWHVPSDAEWTQLTDYVSSQSQFVCGDSSYSIAKALASQTGWRSNPLDSYIETGCEIVTDPSSNNATGFSAVPAGAYRLGQYLEFYGMWTSAYFWSSTERDNSAFSRSLINCYDWVFEDEDPKYRAFSVRCLRD